MSNTDESTIEILRANGYSPGDGEIIGSRREFFYNPGDYAAGRSPTFFRDPVVSFAVIEFAAEEPSKLASKFIDALVSLVAPTDRLLKKYKRPLVRTTETGLQAIYQADFTLALWEPESVFRPLCEYGLKFTDSPDPYSSAQFYAHSGSVALDSAWLSDRTPLNTKRYDLPECPDDMARQLRVLVDSFVSRGEIRERGPYIAPQSRPAVQCD